MLLWVELVLFVLCVLGWLVLLLLCAVVLSWFVWLDGCRCFGICCIGFVMFRFVDCCGFALVVFVAWVSSCGCVCLVLCFGCVCCVTCFVEWLVWLLVVLRLSVVAGLLLLSVGFGVGVIVAVGWLVFVWWRVLGVAVGWLCLL